jgi:hypothetical protein
MARDTFYYCVPGDIKHCPTCTAPTFFYTAHRLTWSYCKLCRVFYSPNREREISRFLATVAQAMRTSVTR